MQTGDGFAEHGLALGGRRPRAELRELGDEALELRLAQHALQLFAQLASERRGLSVHADRQRQRAGARQRQVRERIFVEQVDRAEEDASLARRAPRALGERPVWLSLYRESNPVPVRF